MSASFEVYDSDDERVTRPQTIPASSKNVDKQLEADPTRTSGQSERLVCSKTRTGKQSRDGKIQDPMTNLCSSRGRPEEEGSRSEEKESQKRLKIECVDLTNLEYVLCPPIPGFNSSETIDLTCFDEQLTRTSWLPPNAEPMVVDSEDERVTRVETISALPDTARPELEADSTGGGQTEQLRNKAMAENPAANGGHRDSTMTSKPIKSPSEENAKTKPVEELGKRRKATRLEISEADKKAHLLKLKAGYDELSSWEDNESGAYPDRMELVRCLWFDIEQ